MENTLYCNELREVDGEISLNDWFEIWIRFYKANRLKPTTIDTYRALWDRHIRYAYGHISLNCFRQVHIQLIYDDFLKKGYSARYLNTLHTLLNSLFKRAQNNEIIEKNPCESVERPEYDNSERRVLSREEQVRLCKYIKMPRYAHIEPAITTLLGTGLRIGELLGLRWSDIVFGDTVSTLTVNRTLVRVKNQTDGGSHYLLQTPKSKSSARIIPLQFSVVDALERQKNRQDMYRRKPEWNPPFGFEDLVFSGKKGQPQWRSTVSTAIDNIVKSMNREECKKAYREHRPPQYMERILPHAFRHTFATRCLEVGVPPKVVQTWLGHASIKMTLDLYTHVNQDISVQHMRLLEQAVNID